ncbi:hypothetical protein JCM8202_005751 [Rhodotorula sphaerocarpa]
MASFNVASLKPDIEDILAHSDRSSVSAKAVRKSLQTKYPELDVKAHKAEIDALTTAVFTGESGDGEDIDVKPTVKPKLPSFTKVKRSRSPSTPADADGPTSSPAFMLASAPPLAPLGPGKLTDEELARQLQAEYSSHSAGRSTRNGGSTATAKKRGATKKSKKIVSDDDAVDGSAKKKKRKVSHTGFNKLHLLSEDLADICGVQVLSRPGVTKALWVYIKANELQNPKKKTEILPDDKLKKILPFERINSFTMAKHIGPHLYEFDPVEHAHLVPPDPTSDAESDASGHTDRKPKARSGTPTSSAAGVHRADGRTKSAAEVDSADDED